jgi:hypothetical protein
MLTLVSGLLVVRSRWYLQRITVPLFRHPIVVWVIDRVNFSDIAGQEIQVISIGPWCLDHRMITLVDQNQVSVMQRYRDIKFGVPGINSLNSKPSGGVSR